MNSRIFANRGLLKASLTSSTPFSLFTSGLPLLVLLAVLIQAVFHEADVHYQSSDVQAHTCIFNQTDADPTPPAISLVLLGVYKTYYPVTTYQQILLTPKPFISPVLRAPPTIS